MLGIQVKTADGLDKNGLVEARASYIPGEVRNDPAFLYAILLIESVKIQALWIVPSPDFNRLAYRTATAGREVLEFRASPNQDDDFARVPSRSDSRRASADDEDRVGVDFAARVAPGAGRSGGPLTGPDVIQTRFTRLVGCTVPIQLAGMGSILSPELAAAVSNAGGLGQLTLTGDIEDAKGKLDRLSSMTSRPFGINLLIPYLDREVLELAARRARVIDLRSATASIRTTSLWNSPHSTTIRLARK